MQTTPPDEEKGLSAANAQTPMQTGADATASRQRRQPRTLTPRQTRILLALLGGDQTREAIDRTAGASNSPDEVFRLRRDFGLSIPCKREGSTDRDGKPVQVGIYRMTDDDRTTANHLLGRAA